jgi:hypothetical protein
MAADRRADDGARVVARRPSSLAIHCRAQHTELTISTAGSWKPAIDGEVKIVYRINEEPSVGQRWRSAETGKSLAFPGDVVRFLRSMPDSGQILVKVSLEKVRRMKVRFNWWAWIPSDVRSRQRATGPSPVDAGRTLLKPICGHWYAKHTQSRGNLALLR